MRGSFDGIGVATTDYSDETVHGHAPGGVTITWNTKLDRCVRPLDIHADWCVAIEITLRFKKQVMIFAVV